MCVRALAMWSMWSDVSKPAKETYRRLQAVIHSIRAFYDGLHRSIIEWQCSLKAALCCLNWAAQWIHRIHWALAGAHLAWPNSRQGSVYLVSLELFAHKKYKWHFKCNKHNDSETRKSSSLGKILSVGNYFCYNVKYILGHQRFILRQGISLLSHWYCLLSHSVSKEELESF